MTITEQLTARHAAWRPIADVQAECDGWLDVHETDIDYSIELSIIADELNAKAGDACAPYTFHGYVSRLDRPRTWRAFAVCMHGYAQEM